MLITSEYVSDSKNLRMFLMFFSFYRTAIIRDIRVRNNSRGNSRYATGKKLMSQLMSQLMVINVSAKPKARSAHIN